MADITNDIDALLRALDPKGFGGIIHTADLKRHHASLTAFLKERNGLQEENNALRSRCKAHQDEEADRVFEILELRKRVEELRKRVAELEEEGNGLAEKLQMQRNLRDLDRQFAAQPSSDRELRKDLICAALTGLCANPMHHTQPSNVLSDSALMVADDTIAKMRKGEA